MPDGLYIHIPFCPKRCDYCDFYTLAGRGDLFEPYTAGLLRAMELGPLPAGSAVDTVYFGGGTPTMLGAERLCRVLEGIRRWYALDPDAEITLEANPVAITPQMAARLREGGFNRISMGLQSSDPAQLRDLGRTHTAEKAAEAVGIVRAAGFENLSLDLMLGLPHQTPEEVLASVRFAVELGAVHLSAYMLQLEEGTPYAARYTEADIDEEIQRAIYLSTVAELERQGFEQYEISNFARPGYRSRHNLRYWQGGEYLGIGPAAASCLNGRRFVFPRDIDGFLKAENPWFLCTDEGEAGSPEERVMMALRLREGLDCGALRAACPDFDTASLLARAKEPALRGLVTVSGERIALTPEGFLVSNALIARLLWG